MPAVLGAMKLVINPSLAVPIIHVNKLTDIDFKKLSTNGIKYLVFDKDNTLSTVYSDKMHPSVESVVDLARQAYPSRESMAILSNSAGCEGDDPNFETAKAVEAAFGMAVIRHTHKKPACADEVSSESTSNCLSLIFICRFWVISWGNSQQQFCRVKYA